MKLSELLRHRAALADRSAELAESAAQVNRELASVDAKLFARMKTLAAAIEGSDGADDGDETAPRSADKGGNMLGLADVPSPPRRGLLGLADAARPPKLGPQVISTLREIGQPADRNQIFDALIRKGVHIPGKDPKANLSAHLSYADSIVRLDSGLWALREWIDEADAMLRGEQKQTPA